ncbi:MAG TPA: TadE/TadG family type IV pilus assembly protein [Xanthobacteraceae bacterium]|nr:TadE/TadG family type IV pilus assembly protein [Xanthobacteraceae bacterium]
MTSHRTRLFAFAPVRRFAADQHGVSAVEFAILLPLMLTLYFGGVELSDAVSADRKNTLVAHTVGDLVAAVSNVCTSATVCTSPISDVWNADQWVGYPYATAASAASPNPVTIVTSVCVDTTGRATVSWSQSNDGNHSALAANATINNLPTALTTNTTGASISYIWGQSIYTYRPTMGYGIIGTIRMTDQFYLGARQSCSVTLDLGSKCC